MSPYERFKPQPSDERRSLWDSRIIPSARACERFFWNLMWFVVIVALLFSFNPFRSETSSGQHHMQGSME